jgi:hypothetical protein
MMADAGLIKHLKPSGAPYLENRMPRLQCRGAVEMTRGK